MAKPYILHCKQMRLIIPVKIEIIYVLVSKLPLRKKSAFMSILNQFKNRKTEK